MLNLLKTSGSPKGKRLYICGPPAMMKGLCTQLRAKGNSWDKYPVKNLQMSKEHDMG